MKVGPFIFPTDWIKPAKPSAEPVLIGPSQKNMTKAIKELMKVELENYEELEKRNQKILCESGFHVAESSYDGIVSALNALDEAKGEIENLKMVCRRLAAAKSIETRDKVARQCYDLFKGSITRNVQGSSEYTIWGTTECDAFEHGEAGKDCLQRVTLFCKDKLCSVCRTKQSQHQSHSMGEK